MERWVDGLQPDWLPAWIPRQPGAERLLLSVLTG